MQSQKIRHADPAKPKLSGFGRPAKLVTCTGTKTVTRMPIMGKPVKVQEPIGLVKYEGNVSKLGGVVEVEYVGSSGKVQVERIPLKNVVHLEYRQ